MKLIVFDCDSTLSAIEGIDELARLKGEETFAKIEALTHAAMNGEVPIDEIFSRRLDMIRPSLSDCKKVGEMYIEEIEPTAQKTLQMLRASSWHPVILSGGFQQVIEPLAAHLEIDEVHAVPLVFHDDGSYAGFEEDAPPTRNGGKPEVISQLIAQYQPSATVMVGDGISDLETQSVVDQFIGFGRYAKRSAVVQGADAFVDSLDEVLQKIVK